MEKMYESRLALFNEVVLPNDEELSVEEKRAFRGIMMLSSQPQKEELKTESVVVKQDDPVEVVEIKAPELKSVQPSDWISAKKCKKSKKY